MHKGCRNCSFPVGVTLICETVHMPRFFDPLLHVLACASERQLLAQIQFLKGENQILRSRLPKQIRTTPVERARLLRLAEPLGRETIRHLVTVVSPDTFRRWLRKGENRQSAPRKRVGRPRTPDHICALVLRLADETGLGYTRIRGELKKLGISLARNTIKSILKREHRTPDPHRGEGRWDEFLRMHAETLWACDFLSVRAWTQRGLQSLYLVLFIHLDSRRIFVTPSTVAPTLAWTDEQARWFTIFLKDNGLECTHLIRDRDSKFKGGFDEILRVRGIKAVCLPRWSPNLNAYAERFVRSIKEECLSKIIPIGERHLRLAVEKFAKHYHRERTHQGLGNTLIEPLHESGDGPVLCDDRLGGILRFYYRSAA